MPRPIEHDPDRQQFFAIVEGRRCRLDYQRQGDRVLITHTLVPAELGGRGIAADLTQSALAWIRGQGLSVVPVCSYAARYLEREAGG
ncbi:MAG: GNAT family N-acetyltransferase [Lysobacterales bacterium]